MRDEGLRLKGVWDHSRQSGTARLLLPAIAEHAGAEGIYWLSIGRLAATIEKSVRHTQRQLALLQAADEPAITAEPSKLKPAEGTRKDFLRLLGPHRIEAP